MSFIFPDPPTESSLVDARRSLSATRSSVSELTAKIEAAEAALAQVVEESKCFIDEMQNERAILEKQVTQAMAYLSPIRRLPTELLRDIFLRSFEEHPCCAWVLAAVCSSWRRLTLQMPTIWSKHPAAPDTSSYLSTSWCGSLRVIFNEDMPSMDYVVPLADVLNPRQLLGLFDQPPLFIHVSADTIRLWLERSGDSVPLDIEIFLRVTSKGSASESPTRRRRRSLSRTPSPPPWAMSFAQNHGIATHYVIPHSPLSPTGIAFIPPMQTPILLPPSPGALHEAWLPPHSIDRNASYPSRSSLHWGHIAIYYLAEQMHRWERFIFRFDKQFTSMGALKSISGDAPLLKEFEVSSAESAFYPEWQWLPNAPPNATLVLPKLQTLTLQYTPFKWSSPMLRTNLHTLNLRALPTSHLPLDRILYILANNPSLESLTLHFQGVLPAVLPLSPLTLPLVKTFHIGGHFILSQLVNVLVLPSLADLALDIEAREPIEDTISNLLTRSSQPSLTHLSIAYGSSATTTSPFYYGASGIVISWTTLLAELAHLQSLHVGGTPLEPLLAALGVPDDETNQMTTWGCPKLEVLGMRNCHAHSEGVVKLVQMVEARNPAAGGGGGGSAAPGPVNGVTPVRLKSLELYDCASLGEDVVAWLQSRIGEVVCTELDFDR